MTGRDRKPDRRASDDSDAEPPTMLLRAAPGGARIDPELEPPAPHARLVRLQPEGLIGSAAAVELREEPITLGRGAANAVRLDTYGVSRLHARVYPDAGGWVLEDLGSKNGVWLNEEKVVSPIWLGPGDVVRIGRHVFRFEHVDAAAEDAPAPPPAPSGPPSGEQDLSETAPLSLAEAVRQHRGPDELREEIRARLEPHVDELVDGLLAAARAGDVGAIKLVLAYLTDEESDPPRRG